MDLGEAGVLKRRRTGEGEVREAVYHLKGHAPARRKGLADISRSATPPSSSVNPGRIVNLEVEGADAEVHLTDKQHLSWRLEGLRMSRQRPYPLASHITSFYYTPNWKRRSGVIAVKACSYL
ncbi:hypothetical protein NQZ68_014149, partial [Dissostichus eleginoides]